MLKRTRARISAIVASLALVGGLQIATPAAVADDPEVSIGVMRYDSKNPTAPEDGDTQYSFSFAALQDPKWNDMGYWSFFAETDSSGDLLELNENSVAIAEQENQYAAEAGVDYWAFLHAPSGEIDGLPANEPQHYRASFERYLESSNKSDVGFTWILNYHTFEYDYPSALDEAISYVDDPDYFTVLDGRPLIYIFNNLPHPDLAAKITYIRAEVQALVDEDPYIVTFNSSGDGEDATSDYATRSDDAVVGASYDSYIDRVQQEWENPQNDANKAISGTGAAHSGTYGGLHYKTGTYDVTTAQTVTALSSGTYTLSAWVQASATPGTVEMFARDCGASDQAISVPVNTAYQQISISTVAVTSSSCTIGFSSLSAPGGHWMRFDDVVFSNNSSPSTNLVANPGFEVTPVSASEIQEIPSWETIAPLDPGQEYVPNAPLNWDNRAWAETPPAWHVGENYWNAPPTQDQYRRMMQAAVNHVLENQAINPAMTVVSKEWNGQEEGGNIAPSLRYGASYLDAIRQVEKSAVSSTFPVDDVPQNFLELRTYNTSACCGSLFNQQFSNETRVLQSGDYLEYDVYLELDQSGSGSVGLRTATDQYVFEGAGVDQNGYDAMTNEDISSAAYGQWYHRKIAIPSGSIGQTVVSWEVGADNSVATGTTHSRYDNIEITDGSGVTRQSIWSDSTDGAIGPVFERFQSAGYLSYSDVSGSQGENLIVNPGFESGTGGASQVQNPQGWSTTGPDTSANYAQDGSGDSHSGAYRGVHWSNSSYSVATEQTLSGLTAGSYTLTAWVRSSASPATSYAYAENCGSTDRKYTIPSTGWMQIQIPGVDVSGGSCTIGFRSASVAATEWIAFDDVTFTEDSKNLVANPGFELGTSGAPEVQSPQGWTTSGANPASDYSQSGASNSHSGDYRGVHYGSSTFSVITSQTFTGLVNGSYKLTAWTYAPHFVGTATASVDCGNGSKVFHIPLSLQYQEIRIEDVVVNESTPATGSCTIAFESDASAGLDWFAFDDVAFYRQ